jgi:hypothetical protein
MRFFTKNFLFLCTSMLINYPASAVDLNKPINNTPTVATEIKRGSDAAWQCDSVMTNALDYARCIFKVEELNRQKVVDYQPFDLGLFFAAWLNLDITAGSVKKVMGEDSTRFQDAYREADSMFTLFSSVQAEMKVSDKQLINITKMNQDLVNNKLSSWRLSKK